MTTPTIRDYCADLSYDVDYLLTCIEDGSSDPITLQEIADRANTARAALAAEPAGEGPSAAEVDAAWLATWNSEANCYDVAAFAHAILAGWGHPAAPPAPEVGDGPSLADVDELCEEFEFHLEGDGLEILQQMITAAITRWRAPAAQPAAQPARVPPPAPEVGEVVAWLKQYRDLLHPVHDSDDIVQFTCAATLLEQQQHLLKLAGAELDRLVEQQAAPAPAVVPVAVSERLPDLSSQGSDFNDAGLLWWFQPRLGWRIGSRDALDCIPYPTHWLPFHAIPLPQAGEVPHA